MQMWSRPRFAFRSPFDQKLWFRSIITQRRSVTRVPDDDGTAISAAAATSAAAILGRVTCMSSAPPQMCT
jgi:hypothetical protein